MTEEEIAKLIGKWAIESAPRPLAGPSKEVLKWVVDGSKCWGELIAAVALSRLI